jgi:hypothetical protein
MKNFSLIKKYFHQNIEKKRKHKMKINIILTLIKEKYKQELLLIFNMG